MDHEPQVPFDPELLPGQKIEWTAQDVEAAENPPPIEINGPGWYIVKVRENGQPWVEYAEKVLARDSEGNVTAASFQSVPFSWFRFSNWNLICEAAAHWEDIPPLVPPPEWEEPEYEYMPELLKAAYREIQRLTPYAELAWKKKPGRPINATTKEIADLIIQLKDTDGLSWGEIVKHLSQLPKSVVMTKSGVRSAYKRNKGK